MQNAQIPKVVSHVNARMVSLVMALNVMTTTNVLATHVAQMQTAKTSLADSDAAAKLDTAVTATTAVTSMNVSHLHVT